MSSPEPLDIFSLEGQVALVTGASRGIGAAISLGFARAGADVALVARSREPLEVIADEIRTIGRRAFVVPCDVTMPSQIDDACARVIDEYGNVDILFNNAGGPVFHAHVLDARDDGWQRIIDLNLMSVFRFCRGIGNHMAGRGAGSIINVASLAHSVWPVFAGYLAAKAAVLSYTESLAVDLGPQGVRANAICPGAVDTDITGALAHNPSLSDLAVSMIPLGRWAVPEDLVGTAIWLGSDASRYVTGAVIAIDGGLLLSAPKDWLARLDGVLDND